MSVLEVVEIPEIGFGDGGVYHSTTQTYRFAHSEEDVLRTWAWVSRQDIFEFKYTHGSRIDRVELRRDGVVIDTLTKEQARERGTSS